MNTMPSSAQSEFVTASALATPLAEAPPVRPAKLDSDQLPAKSLRLRKLAPLTFARHMSLLLIGVAATLAWQTYGDAAKHMIVSAAYSLDQQRFSATSPDLDATRESIERLAIGIEGLVTSIAHNQEQIMDRVDQLTAGQEQMTREIATLHAVDQYVIYKNSDHPPPPVPAPVPKPVLRPSQAPTALTPARNP
jgi:hypothetical protein